MRSIIITINILFAFSLCGWSEDWSTYRHDNRRSAITSESVKFPLKELWTYSSSIPPQTAWSGPAKWDSYANLINLKSMRDFDPVYYTIVVENRVFWGSSVDDAVHCARLSDGKEQWAYCTDGPVRVAPSWYEGKVYFGSDDGYAYCVNADNGKLVWSYKPSPESKKIPSDGKLISPWPCRTGAFVQNGIVYFAASLLPWEDSYLCAVDAKTGSDQGEGLYKIKHAQSAMQSAILASEKNLYLSHGRQQPQVYDIGSGRKVGVIGDSGDGGSYAILTEDDILIHGRGQNHDTDGELRGFNAQTKDHLATFPNANCMVIQKEIAYLHSNGKLTAFDRAKNMLLQSNKLKLQSDEERYTKEFKKLKDPKGDTEAGKKLLETISAVQVQIKAINQQLPSTFNWKIDVPFFHSMILADDALILGGENLVAAYNISNGEQLWSAAVEGNVHGLTYANGHLVVSTDLGKIVCFAGLSQSSSNSLKLGALLGIR